MVDYRDVLVYPTAAQVAAGTVDPGQDGRLDTGFHIQGECPRCHPHLTSSPFLTGTIGVVGAPPAPAAGPQVAALVGAPPGAQQPQLPAADAGPVAPHFALISCCCVETHDKAPAGRLGCGAKWLLKATFDVRGPADDVVLQPMTSEEEAVFGPGAIAEAVSSSKPLDVVRASASAWQTTLTAILGVLGLGALLGRDTIQALSGGNQTVVLVAFVLAVLADAVALALITMASGGLPRFRPAGVADALRHYDEQPLAEAEKSVYLIQAALVATAVSLIAGIVAVGTAWIAPAATPTPPNQAAVTYTTPAGTVTECGQLVAAADSTTALALSVNGSTRLLQASQIVRIAPC